MPGVAAAAATFSVTAIKPNPADPFSGCIQGTLFMCNQLNIGRWENLCMVLFVGFHKRTYKLC